MRHPDQHLPAVRLPDTQLDCSYGEFCDATSGECYADDRPHCQSCDVYSNPNCGPNAECVPFTSTTCRTNADCESGWKCDDFVGGRYCHQDSCLVRCQLQNASSEQCPRGFDCVSVYSDGSLNACYGDCEWMLENGL